MVSVIRVTQAPLPDGRSCVQNPVKSDVVGRATGTTTKLKRMPGYQQASTTLAHLVRNSAIAVLVAWGANYLITLGNVFSGSKPANQSLAVFTTSLMVWTAILIGLTDVVLHGVSLLHAHLLSRPDERPSLLWCVCVLLWRTFHWLVATVMACFGATYVLCKYVPVASKWKMYFYVGVVVSHVYRTRIIQVVRRIFESATVEGFSRRNSNLDSSWRKLLSKNMSMVLSVFIPILYVQGASHLNLTSSTELLVFSGVSLLVKLFLQEATIKLAMRGRRIQIDRMHAMISIPTVLIDTQVRILLLRATQLDDDSSSPGGISSSQLRWWGSLVLGVFEIIVRVSRMLWLHRRIRQRWRTRDQPGTRMIMVVANRVQPIESCDDTSNMSGSVEASEASSEITFQLWKSRRLALYAAEAQADMHAEYISIGCSLSIYHFCRDPSKFEIRTTNTSSPSHLSSSYAQVIVFQVAIKLLVDFLCTSLEILSGIPFHVPQNMGIFLISLYASCALGNIALSAAMFLRYDEKA